MKYYLHVGGPYTDEREYISQSVNYYISKKWSHDQVVGNYYMTIFYRALVVITSVTYYIIRKIMTYKDV